MKKLDRFKVELNVINCSIWVYIGDDIKDAVERNKDHYNEITGYKSEDLIQDPTEISGCVFDEMVDFNANFSSALMLIRSNITAGEIAHETNHAINRIFSRIGHKPKRDNDEIQSYYLGHVVDKINDFKNNWNK